jgi:hypothetical protein
MSVDALNRRLLQDKINYNTAIHAQTLQFTAAAEERYIKREALDQPRLPALPQSLPAVDPSSKSFIQSPIFINFYSKFPAIPKKQLVRVFKWPNRDFKAYEIFKLIISDAFSAKDNCYDETLINRTITYQRKHRGRGDYPSIAT